MAKLGAAVVYMAHEGHAVKTVRGGKVERGSIYHRSQDSFAGIVTSMNADGTFGVLIFPPNGEPKHVDNATEGDGPHQFRLVHDGLDAIKHPKWVAEDEQVEAARAASAAAAGDAPVAA